jgi:hypothetical protein
LEFFRRFLKIIKKKKNRGEGKLRGKNCSSTLVLTTALTTMGYLHHLIVL